LGLCIVALGLLDAGMWLAVLKVAVGLGMVIFVHELGHFSVAKLCGVKCEKFYLGFDIGGWKLCKFSYGETEYGIGILPLGGYVKMLGQEDNPARLQEEIERAKQKPAQGEQGQQAPPADQAKENQGEKEKQTEDEPGDLAAAEAALYDPRSYLAQSVPKRMAIISAGVIMNLLFAFLMAVIAYKMGVKQMACGVGQIIPGGAAWQVNLKVGDRITNIGGEDVHRFRDLREAISLGDNIEQGIPIVVRRPGVEQPLRFSVKPDSSGLVPVIGVVNPRTSTLLTEDLAVRPGSAAARAKPPFELGDKIVRIDKTPIGSYRDLHACLALHGDKTLAVTVQRAAQGDAGRRASAGPAKELTIEVPPNPMYRLGLVMELGEISAVQADSPAATAGIIAGDRIVKIDGQPPGDPMTLPDRLRRRAGDTVTLTIERESDTEPSIDIPVALRRADWYECPMIEGDPMTAPALGIAYRVLNRVHSAVAGSPAAAAGLRSGDRIVQAIVYPPDKDTLPADLPLRQKKITIDFDEEHRNWPSFIFALQETLPGTQVELKWLRRQEREKATLAPVADDEWFNPDRGFLFEPVYFYQTADSWAQAVRFGGEERRTHGPAGLGRHPRQAGRRAGPGGADLRRAGGDPWPDGLGNRPGRGSLPFRVLTGFAVESCYFRAVYPARLLLSGGAN